MPVHDAARALADGGIGHRAHVVQDKDGELKDEKEEVIHKYPSHRCAQRPGVCGRQIAGGESLSSSGGEVSHNF